MQALILKSGRENYQSTPTNTHMRDYRKYTELYKTIGFFVVIVTTFTLAYKATAWFIWAHQFVDAAL